MGTWGLSEPKTILVTRKTRLEELIQRFNTPRQARFYIEKMGLDFRDYEDEHETYHASLARVADDLRDVQKMQTIERAFLPNFMFGREDVCVTVGPDGLVVNAAKYLDGQPVVAVNPDPRRIDGILLAFAPDQARHGVRRVLDRRANYLEVTMAEAKLNDGQTLLAFNDFLIGHRSHVSARYRLGWRGKAEAQSSSGVLVATGAGSTGWLSSTRQMAQSVARMLLADKAPRLPELRLKWNDPRLAFVVREPFASRATGVTLTAGLVESGEELRVESLMPEGGVIFSDGVEADALKFNSGAVATVRAAEQHTRLVANP
jgi:NAD kinase